MLGVSPEDKGKAANELSQLILAPVADKLGQKRLVIVGDEALQYIPFAALTTSTKSADGSDDRIPMTSRDYPWSAIGKIEGISADGGGYSCTGTLIAEDVVLTNAHCVVNPETRKVSQAIAFEPNLVNGVVKNKSDVAYATNVYTRLMDCC
ncbi:MAG: trypsin-like serine protease [Nostoc sp.]|uniref:trypsin-like serine peptidase n=1 Tax=Nostoc sp. TaxID=1180 RepID=UPI002FFC8283